MKKLSIVLLLFLLSIVTIKSQPNTSSLVEVRKVDEMVFKFKDTITSGSRPSNFLFLGNDNFFVSGNYSNAQSPWYGSCVAYVNFNTKVLWKQDFFFDDLGKQSNLSSVVVNEETLLTATTPNGLNYYSSSGELKKTIPQLSGYRQFFPFYNHNLVVTSVNAKVYAHKLNFETGQLLDSFFITTSVSWIDDVKEYNGDIYLCIRKADGGVAKTLLVRLNENGIVWQTTISKVGQSRFAVTPSVIYVAGDSITMTGITAKLIALDSTGIEIWRRSYEYLAYGGMTLSKSVVINPLNNDCIIGGKVADGVGANFISSWNENGELLWEYWERLDGYLLQMWDMIWNEKRELIFFGDGRDENNTSGVSLTKYSIQGITTGLPAESQNPVSYSSEQNYPNPFNPSTTIQYSLPAPTMVLLKVYDIMGNEVATLVNSHQPAGTYKVPFDGHNLPSGVYFYRLKTPEFSSTNKMVLNK